MLSCNFSVECASPFSHGGFAEIPGLNDNSSWYLSFGIFFEFWILNFVFPPAMTNPLSARLADLGKRQREIAMSDEGVLRNELMMSDGY